MANQVTDNRTLIADGTTVSGWEDLSGSPLAVDTDIRYDTYSGSIGQYVTTSRDATMYNNGSTGLFTAGDHAYLLFNCGVVSLVDTKALGGLTVRVTGATISDWAEFELFGSDNWPSAFAGGWSQIVVDIDELLASPTNTNGTPPTVANIQRFGITFITASVMPRMTDNIWTGGFFRLPVSTPSIIVEGRSGGTVDWTYALIAADAGIQLGAVLKPGPGGSYVCRGPVQFGINDTSTHAFTDTNKTLLWDFQEVMVDGFYGLSALGNAGGTTNVTFGIKTGALNDATGAQGGVIQADSTAARWFLDFDGANLDGVNFYGVSMVHGGTFQLDSTSVSCISTLYIDCTQAQVSNSEQLRISVIDANTLDGAAFMVTDDFSDIVFSSFFFSDGHAIELNGATPTAQDNVGNLFSGYVNTVNSTDAAILNSAAGALVLSSSNGSNLQTNSYRNTGGGSVSILNNISVTFTNMRDNSEVRIYTAGTNAELSGIEDASAGSVDARTFPASIAAATAVDYVIHNWQSGVAVYQTIRVNGFSWPTADANILVQQQIDRNAV